jgi:NAD-dependent dihydropyrimidine dehydrogenase PreA subunit
MRFPMWERVEMTLLWSIPTAALTGLALGFLQGWAAGLVAAIAVLGAVLGIFALIPHVPVTGPKRWLTFLAGAGTIFGATLVGWLPLGHLGAPALAELGTACVLTMGVLAVDLPGTTPWYPSSVNVGDRFRIELVADRCTGAAECLQVCPRNVLELHHHRIELARPDDCIRCGACIVQCPEDALRFRFSDGEVVEPATIRSTRLNLLGHRTVVVDPEVGSER